MDRRKHTPDRIELISRAVIFDPEKKRMLFCSPRDKSYFYLPGGHIEWGETAISALRREIKEETGVELSLESFRFAGAGENMFSQRGTRRHEVNMYFRVDDSLKKGEDIASKEGHLVFTWIPLEQIPETTIYPSSVKQRCAIWAEKDTIGWQ